MSTPTRTHHNSSRASTLLTPREVEVLVHLARGRSKPEAATLLGISVHTVNRHTTNLMAKARIHSRADLVRWAIREKLVEP